MKFTTLLLSGRPELAAVDNDGVLPLGIELRAALTAGTDVVAHARRTLAGNATRLPWASVVLAPVVPDPGKTICLGLNYIDHAKEGGRDKPEYPWFFFRGTSSLIAHDADAWVPRVSSRFDYEAELAVVIGSSVPRHTKQADALKHVFGYTCFNDLSVRDYQKRTPQWTIGKNFDATGALGPLLVTADELPAGAAGLRIEGRLNGAVMQSANTSDMLFGVAETIALLAEVLTLKPGDVIAMGTPAGVGQARTPPVWLKAGDRFEVEIEGIGVLANPITNEPAA